MCAAERRPLFGGGGGDGGRGDDDWGDDDLGRYLAEFDTMTFAKLVGDSDAAQKEAPHYDHDGDDLRDPTVLMYNRHSDRRRYPGRVIIASTSPWPYRYRLVCNAQRAIAEQLAFKDFVAPQDFYLIERNRPVRCYFDFDCGADELMCDTAGIDERQFIVDCANTIVYFCCYVDALWPACRGGSGRAFYDGQWRLYSACMPSLAGSKLSVHAHADLLFADVKHLRWVVRRFVALMGHLRDHGFAGAARMFKRNGRSVLDTAVCTTRPFRLPLNRKSALAPYNYLWPVALERQQPLDDRPDYHLACGFVHPDPSIHANISLPLHVLPADLLPTRQRQAGFLASCESCCPLATWAELDTFVATLVARTFNLPAPEVAGQLHQRFRDDDDNNQQKQCCHQCVERAFLASGSGGGGGGGGQHSTDDSLATYRQAWLSALCAIILVLDPATLTTMANNAEGEGECSAAWLLQAAYDFALAPTCWGARIDQLLSVHGLRYAPMATTTTTATTTTADDDTPTAQAASENDSDLCTDFGLEHAFSTFYMRIVHYYKTYTNNGRREQLVRFIGGDGGDDNDDETRMMVTGSDRRWRREFAWFRQLPAQLFSVPQHAITLDRVSKLCDQNPLSSPADAGHRGRLVSMSAPGLPSNNGAGIIGVVYDPLDSFLFL